MILTLNISFPQLYTYGYMDAFTSACIVKHALCLFVSCEHSLEIGSFSHVAYGNEECCVPMAVIFGAGGRLV